MSDQLNLLLPARDRDLASRYAPAVTRYLAEARDWRLRRQIVQTFPELNERVIRVIADRSHGQIIGTDKGYKLQRHATTEEYFAWENRLRSQARAMLRRIVQARKARNGVAA